MTKFILAILLLVMWTHNVSATVLFESGWERPGAATVGNCDDLDSGEDCTYGSTCLDSDTSADGCKVSADTWDNLGVQSTLDLRTQTDQVHSGSYAFEIEARSATAELRYDLLLQDTANHSALFDAFKSEYYATYWIYFSPTYKFPPRFKGLKFHDYGNAYNTSGGDSISTKVGASGLAGYGISNSDGTEKDALLSTVDEDHGHLILSNYASHSADYPSSGLNECHTADDVDSTIGTNTPQAVNQDMSGPADNGTSSDPYWPGADNQKVYFTTGKWYQVILYLKIHDTEGVQSAWIREGVNGTLYKVIHADKDAWAGTTYDTGTFDTRCFRPGATAIATDEMALPAGTINAGSSIPIGAKIYIDDFAVATTFAEVEEYGLDSTPVDGSCGDESDQVDDRAYGCTTGTSTNHVDGATSTTWDCEGTGGSLVDDSCSAAYSEAAIPDPTCEDAIGYCTNATDCNTYYGYPYYYEGACQMVEEVVTGSAAGGSSFSSGGVSYSNPNTGLIYTR